MEELLRVAQRQRDLHVERLKRRNVKDISGKTLTEMHMDGNDMKEIFNTWRADVESWMRPSKLTEYNAIRYQRKQMTKSGKKISKFSKAKQAQQMRKTGFSSYLFQLSGCKFLLHKLIELPLMCSVEQPAAVLNKLLDAYKEHKKTKQFQDAVERSREHQAKQLRLSKQVWWAQYNYAQGRQLSFMV